MRKGQSLIELVIALGVGVSMMGVATGGLFLALKSGQFAQQNQSASIFVESLSNMVVPSAEQNWHNIYGVPNKGSAYHYFIATSTGQLIRQTGDQQLSVGGIDFTRYFYVENVSRDNNGKGNIEAVYDGNNDDPSTQKITFVSTWTSAGANGNVTSAIYLSRWPNLVFRQTDWSGGPGQAGPITLVNDKFDSQLGLDYTSVRGSLLPASSSCDGCELTSSIIDVGIAGGATFNTIMWQGNKGTGDVKFKFASSNCPNGENNYPACTTGNWNWSGQPLRPAGPNIQEFIPRDRGANFRYFKFKILVDSADMVSPKIDDVIINWSR